MEERQQQKQIEAIENNKELIRKKKQWSKLLNSEKQKEIKVWMKLTRSQLKKLIKDKFYPYRQPLKKWLSYTQEEWMKVLCKIDWIIIYSL